LHWNELQRYRLAIAAGLLLTLAFPKFDIAGLAWIGPGVMLAAAAGFSGGSTFRIGFVAGLAFHLGALYWLLLIPMGLPWTLVVILGWIGLSAFLAFYQGLWVWLAWRLFPARDEEGDGGLLSALKTVGAIPWWKRSVWCLSVAALWVATEMIQARFLTGFPWGLLGVSQYRMIPLIQITAITGVYGVSFLLVWFSASLLCSTALLLGNPSARRTWMADLFAPVLMVAILFGLGMSRILHMPPAPRQIKAALIQPSIPQSMIWDEREAMTRFQQVLELSGKALAEKPKPDLLVWPEAAVPSLFLWDTNLYDGKTIYDWITGLARDQHIWLIMGADDAEPLPNGKVDYYNSSFLIDPSGEVLGKYRKRRLVIFGEYVPFSRWLPILSTLVQSHGEFQPGNQPVAFRLGALNVVTSVLICFEDVFPHLTREYVDPDTDFLLNLTNNGWFGESAAQWQHAASAVFRAVENNLPLVRCANNGLTCWVDRRGRMHNVFYDYSRNIYEAGYKIVDVPVGSTAKYIPTFYRRHGDLFGWGCCVFSLLLVALAQLRKRAARRTMDLPPR
jgi:apolipoprotein N-acyltransferase